MNNSVTLYLADDHQIVVDGLQLLVSTEENIKIIGSANDGDTAWKEIQLLKPDLALLDLRMPGMSGLELVYNISRAVPATRVVILSMHDSPRDIRDAMKGGAAGYLLKNTGKTDLIRCLVAVIRGERYFPHLAKAKDKARISLFTPRELEVLKLVLEEYTTVQIAEKLCLSPHTVDVHRKNIGRKTGTSNAIGLIKFLQENQIKL